MAETFYFEVRAYVLFSKRDATGTLIWTEAQAQDLLDQVMAQVVATLRAKRGNGSCWLSLRGEGRSTIQGPDPLTKEAWLWEPLPIAATVRPGVTREEVRTALAALLKGGVPLAQRVEDHHITDFGIQFPVVTVASTGDDPGSFN